MIRPLVLAVVTMAAGSSGSAQTPSFTSTIEAIRVDVLVVENGRPVLGLRPGDFEVRDNGVLQNVDLASYEENPLNLILVLDMSASLEGERLHHLRSAGNTLLDGLKETDQAALVTFSHFVFQGAPLTSDFSRVRAALDEAAASGQTSLVDASFTAMMIGESDVGRSLMIVFSDGVDTRSWLEADAVLEIAKRGDIVVYGVAVGRRPSHFLTDLGAATGGRLIEIESTRDLNGAFRRVLDEFRQRYLISYSPQGVATGGWHRLDVRVKGRNLTVRARPGYLSERKNSEDEK
jgi:Ca-activated chloride channel homolog